jgi:hypothetical protein
VTQTPPPSSSTPASAPLPAALVMPSEMTHYVIPLGFAHRSAVALLRASLFTRSFTAACIVLFALYLVLMGLDAADIVESGSLSWIVPVGFGFIFVLAVVIYVAQRRSTTALLPTGSTLSARFDAETFWERTPIAEQTVRYDAFEKLIEQSGFVFLKTRRGGIASALPRELVPCDAWLDYIRSQLAPASRR